MLGVPDNPLVTWLAVSVKEPEVMLPFASNATDGADAGELPQSS